MTQRLAVDARSNTLSHEEPGLPLSRRSGIRSRFSGQGLNGGLRSRGKCTESQVHPLFPGNAS